MKPAGRKVMYVLSIFFAAEMEKATMKRSSKNASLWLDTDEPWDTMKAQILVQVEQALSPQHLDFSKYEVMFYIPRVLPKPGLVLATDTDYNYMVEHACNIKTADPIINLVIVEKKDPENKENLPGDKGAEAKPKKKVSTHISMCRHKSDLASSLPKILPLSQVTSTRTTISLCFKSVGSARNDRRLVSESIATLM